jgi:hypothetical protein
MTPERAFVIGILAVVFLIFLIVGLNIIDVHHC